MIKFWAIVQNTFLQTIRQPIFFVLILLTFTILVLELPLAGWTMGTDYHETDQKMLVNLGLSTLLISSLLIAVFSASSVLSREIEDRTALTVVAKPVPRVTFVLGKYVGVSAAVALAYYLCTIVFLMTVRHGVLSAASDPYDVPVIVLGITAMVAALVAALLGNLFFGWSFPSGAVWAMVILFTLTAGTLTFIGKDWQIVPPGYDVPAKRQYRSLRVTLPAGGDPNALIRQAIKAEYQATYDKSRGFLTLKYPKYKTDEIAIQEIKGWAELESIGPSYEPPIINDQILIALALLLLAVLVLCAIAITASTRLGLVLTLMTAFGTFLLGSWHAFLFNSPATRDVLILRPLSWVIPNLGRFYPLDALTADRIIHLNYFAAAAGYAVVYTAATMALGAALFQRRQLASEGTSSSMPPLVAVLSWLGQIGALGVVIYALAIMTTSAFNWHLALRGGIILIAASGLWFLWGKFGHGARWAYWSIMLLVAATLVWRVAVMAGANALAIGAGTDPLQSTIATMVIAFVLFLLVLPKTRHHFDSVETSTNE